MLGYLRVGLMFRDTNEGIRFHVGGACLSWQVNA